MEGVLFNSNKINNNSSYKIYVKEKKINEGIFVYNIYFKEIIDIQFCKPDNPR